MRHRTSPLRHAFQPCVVAGLFLLAAACGGKKNNATDTTGAAGAAAGGAETGAAAAAPGSTSTAAPAGSTSTAAPSGSTSTSGAAASASSITPKMVALGDSIFHGQAAGGMCYTCHGANAEGTPLAPPLKKDGKKWLTGDGSYGFIVKRVQQGMPTPTPPYTAPMPPMGGAQLTQQQIQAVAAYVYSLNHKVG